MWRREELPFSIAESNEELERNIEIFDEKLYEKTMRDFMEKHEVVEDGHASARVAEFVKNSSLASET